LDGGAALALSEHGVEHGPAALDRLERRLLADLAVRRNDLGRPGVQLAGDPALSGLLRDGSTLDQLAKARLGPAARPVRALLFDKRPGSNWALGWHQDRTIAVRARVDTIGFGPWSVKDGVAHVEPPFSLIEGMITLRAHLDAVAPDNAPLLVALRSHRLGRIAVGEMAGIVARSVVYACVAQPGDVWLSATPIVHASQPAAAPAHRRVLQVDYAASSLPNGLEWLGV
jgi:hypothetical protein